MSQTVFLPARSGPRFAKDIACLLPLFFGFILPAGQLLLWAMDTYGSMVDSSFIRLTLHSIVLSAAAAALAVVLALFLGYGKRLFNDRAVSASIRVVATGYAIPGTVVAVGVIIPLAWLDNQLDGFLRDHFDHPSGLLLSGSLFALMFAYMVRFLSVSVQSVESGLGQIGLYSGEIFTAGTPAIDESDRPHCIPDRVCRCHEGIAGDLDTAPVQFQHAGSARVRTGQR